MLARLHVHKSRVQNVAPASLFSHFSSSPSGTVAFSSCCPRSHSAHVLSSRYTDAAHRRLISTKTSSALHEVAKVSEGPNPLVFQSTSTNPYHNLSIEDYLLRNSDHSSRILFFYTNRPCVVIGRNQNPWLECNLHRLRDGLPNGVKGDQSVSASGLAGGATAIDLVRRRSGGGTVFHDLGNLNYSVIVPNDKDFNRRKHAEMVVRGLNNLTNHDFASNIKVNDRHDIVMQKHGQGEWLKISGSAFKLTRGRALHHGTLLYSSPYLHQISDFLRSPGRGHIHAKGVESVRSKVGNLAWLENPNARDKLMQSIINSITTKFLALYCPEKTTQAQTVEVSDEDCQMETNGTIAAGVEELMTNEWRFGQTPRFDFDSGVLQSLQVQFHANRGVLESLKIKDMTSDGSVAVEGTPHGPIELHKIDSWKTVIKYLQLLNQSSDSTASNIKRLGEKVVGNGVVMERLESIFPRVD